MATTISIVTAIRRMTRIERVTSRVNPARHGTPPRLGALRVTAAAVVLFAGVTAALAAFSASVGRQMPLAALGLWPVNGDVYARAATGSIVAFVGKSGNATQALPANLPRQVGEFALKALAPLFRALR